MTAISLRLALIAAFALPGVALAARSDWVPADVAKMRVLLTGPSDTADGTVQGGVEILLEPGWYTYWRNPGEAGVPPIFDFSGSTNVAKVDVLYPAPMRYDDGFSVSLVYHDEALFPLVVTPEQPGESVMLQVSLSFGVCKDVCIPTQASAAVTLPPDAARDALAEARLDSFLRRVPGAAEPEHLAVEDIFAEDNALLIDVRMPDSSYSDLFADPPVGWHLGQPSLVSRTDGVSRYRLSLAGKPQDAELRGQVFRFVAVAGGDAIAQDVTIR